MKPNSRKLNNIYSFCKENNLKILTSQTLLFERYNQNNTTFSFELNYMV